MLLRKGIYKVSQNYVNTIMYVLRINGFYNLSVNIILTNPVYPDSKHAKTNKMKSTKKFDNSYSRKGFRKRDSKKILDKIEANGLKKKQYKYF